MGPSRIFETPFPDICKSAVDEFRSSRDYKSKEVHVSPNLRDLSAAIAILTVAVLTAGCNEPIAPRETGSVVAPSLRASSTYEPAALGGNSGGAIVLNPGEGKPNGFCYFGSYNADQMTAVRSPNGHGILNCHFSGLPPVPSANRVTGFGCFLNLGIYTYTTETIFVQTPSGEGQMTCRFPT